MFDISILQNAEGVDEKTSNTIQLEELEHTKTSTVEKLETASNFNENIEQKDTINKNDSTFEEIEKSNIKSDKDESSKDKIEEKAYDAMSLEALTAELEKLIKQEKIQSIKTHVNSISTEFKSKFQILLDQKKEEFLNEGGNQIDFHYASPVQKKFKDLYKDYRKKLNEYHQDLEKKLKQNLAEKLAIIEEIKNLINLKENINTTYKHFKDLQERWHNSGPIPKDKYNNAWNSYQHHVEVFYDFLHLNRDLRDLDFKHNLDKKLKIIERAEELAEDDNVMRAFRELQELHKLWKEDLGPVDKKYREDIWDKFKAVTKKINDKKQAYYQEIDKINEQNLIKKLDIIERIKIINSEELKPHSVLQKKIKEIEALKNNFLNAGKVPLKENENTWAKYKDAIRDFNKQKNNFYKDLKKEQYQNLQKKLELLKIAEDNKDSEDYDKTMPLMKKIQSDWKKIGHVPRKDSDKIWNQFRSACNHFFEKINEEKNAATKENEENYAKKNEFLNHLKKLQLTDNKNQSIALIKEQISLWKNLGKVPNDKRQIENEFQKTIDTLLDSLKMNESEIEMIKFENKLENLSSSDNNKLLDNERVFIKKKISEINNQINQLENNLQFFTNVDENNPLVKDVYNDIKLHRDSLSIWKSKLQKINTYFTLASE